LTVLVTSFYFSDYLNPYDPTFGLVALSPRLSHFSTHPAYKSNDARPIFSTEKRSDLRIPPIATHTEPASHPSGLRSTHLNSNFHSLCILKKKERSNGSMCWQTTYTDNFGCGCVDVNVRPVRSENPYRGFLPMLIYLYIFGLFSYFPFGSFTCYSAGFGSLNIRFDQHFISVELRV
jgi:hypothetical protein